MTPEAQRIAIAEALGWQMFPAGKDSFGTWCEPHASREHVAILQSKLPDYLQDLNAMHEATKGFDLKQTVKFSNSLLVIIQDSLCIQSAVDARYLTVNATAAQRAEAFLKAIGKWTE